MSDDSHTAYEPYPTAAMDRQHREDNVIRPEIICTRKIYSEAAYTKLDDEYAKLWQMYGELEDKYNRLKDALKRIDAVTYTHDHEYGLTLARIARSALQEAGDEV